MNSRVLHERIAELEEELLYLKEIIREFATPILKVPGLTKSENKLLHLIYRAPHILSKDSAVSLMSTHSSEEVTVNTLTVFLVKIRRKLSTLNLDVIIKTEWGSGWSMDQPSKEALKPYYELVSKNKAHITDHVLSVLDCFPYPVDTKKVTVVANAIYGIKYKETAILITLKLLHSKRYLLQVGDDRWLALKYSGNKNA